MSLVASSKLDQFVSLKEAFESNDINLINFGSIDVGIKNG
jgi:hypothetical protein